MSRTSAAKREATRRAWCRERARIRAYVLDNGRRSFAEILAAVRRRWPVSATGDDFAAELRADFEREQTERAAWYRERAGRVFAAVFDARRDFDQLAACVRRRFRKLATVPEFASELRRLFDQAQRDAGLTCRPTGQAPG